MRTLAALALLAATPAVAEPPESVVTAEVLPGWRAADGTLMAGLRLTLAPGWHTYWRAPGDAGIPPLFDWAGSENLKAVDVLWPTPVVFSQNGMESIGYLDQIVLPLELTPAADGPVRLRGEVDLGVCDDICVPAHLTVDAALPADGPRNPQIIAALIDQPLTAAEAGAGAVTCRTDPAADGLRLTARLALPPTGGAETVVIETGDPGLYVSPAEVTRQGNTLTAVSDVMEMGGDAFALDRSSLRITVLGADRAVDIRGCAAG